MKYEELLLNLKIRPQQPFSFELAGQCIWAGYLGSRAIILKAMLGHVSFKIGSDKERVLLGLAYVLSGSGPQGHTSAGPYQM